MSRLKSLPATSSEDTVIVPGFVLREMNVPAALRRWVRDAGRSGAHMCSVCTGTFVFGEAGLLDGRECTTHWKRVQELQQRFPSARVLNDRLFVSSGSITSSAGIASGIDMALALIEQDHGPMLAAKVAREMVVYLRRDGHQKQESVFLDFRSHLNPGVHEAQDYIVANAAKKMSIAELAKRATMSPRNLTRAFRKATGLSIADYRTRVRLELAQTMMSDPKLTLDAVAERCGFHSARHLRRAWKEAFGRSPSNSRTPRS
jgi:transcriptional regulator GlxA family with amidase domain